MKKSIANIFKSAGWSLRYPGGAYEYFLPDGTEFLATNEEVTGLPTDMNKILVGLYKDGETILEPSLLDWTDTCELVSRNVFRIDKWDLVGTAKAQAFVKRMPDKSVFRATNVPGNAIPTDLNRILLVHFLTIKVSFIMNYTQVKEVLRLYNRVLSEKINLDILKPKEDSK